MYLWWHCHIVVSSASTATVRCAALQYLNSAAAAAAAVAANKTWVKWGVWILCHVAYSNNKKKNRIEILWIATGNWMTNVRLNHQGWNETKTRSCTRKWMDFTWGTLVIGQDASGKINYNTHYYQICYHCFLDPCLTFRYRASSI